MKDILIVGMGGFIGSAARYTIYLSMTKYYADKPYLGTLVVNLAGCFLIGLLGGGMARPGNQAGLFLMAGLCGGFTTFSTFALDGLKLLRDGSIVPFILYASISMGGGLALCLTGAYLINKT